jgi:hypothetical protein
MTPWQKLKARFVRPDTPCPAKSDAKPETRITIRRPMRLARGFIWCDRMVFPKECSIRNLSGVGACIELCDNSGKSDSLADILILYLPFDKREIECRVVWRKGHRMGIRFSGKYREPTRRYGV